MIGGLKEKLLGSPHGAGGKGTGTGEKSAGCRGTFKEITKGMEIVYIKG